MLALPCLTLAAAQPADCFDDAPSTWRLHRHQLAGRGLRRKSTSGLAIGMAEITISTPGLAIEAATIPPGLLGPIMTGCVVVAIEREFRSTRPRF